MAMQITARQQNIIDIITAQQQAPISKIKKQLQDDVSMPTLNREMAVLVAENYLLKIGRGRATSYSISPFYKVFAPLAISDYFDKEPDARDAATGFNYDLLDILKSVDLHSGSTIGTSIARGNSQYNCSNNFTTITLNTSIFESFILFLKHNDLGKARDAFSRRT